MEIRTKFNVGDEIIAIRKKNIDNKWQWYIADEVFTIVKITVVVRSNATRVYSRIYYIISAEEFIKIDERDCFKTKKEAQGEK